MLNCELTQPMPVARAFSIAISAARFMTRWPMPLSPFRTAVPACSCTTWMFGRTLKPPALIRLTYCGKRLTPCPSDPCRSAAAIRAATVAASASGKPTAVSAC